MSPVFVSGSKYKKLLHEAYGLRVKVKELTSEVDALKRMITDLRSKNEEYRKRTHKSQDIFNKVMEERDRLRSSYCQRKSHAMFIMLLRTKSHPICLLYFFSLCLDRAWNTTKSPSKK